MCQYEHIYFDIVRSFAANELHYLYDESESEKLHKDTKRSEFVFDVARAGTQRKKMDMQQKLL